MGKVHATRSGSIPFAIRLWRLAARAFASLIVALGLPSGVLAATATVNIDLSTSVAAVPIITSGKPGCGLPPPPSLFGPGPETYSYGQTTFTTPAGGNYVFEVTALSPPSGAPNDPVILVYLGTSVGTFTPGTPAVNLVACDDNGNVDPSLPPTFSRLVVSPGTAYTVVVITPQDLSFSPGTTTATLSFALEPTITFANKSVALGATGQSMTASSDSTGTISYAIQDPSVALIDPILGALTTVGAGNTQVAALQARDAGGTYGSGFQQATLTVTASQTITFNNPGAQTFGTTPTLTATASSSLAVTFTSATTGVCTITSGGALTFVTTGTCTINADQAGDATYSAAPQVSRSFSVACSAGFTGSTCSVCASGYFGATCGGTCPGGSGASACSAHGTCSDGLAGSGICSCNSGYAGAACSTCAAGFYLSGSACVPKLTQTITFANPGPQTFGTTPTLTATATSTLAVTFTSATTSVCTITSGGALTFATTGTCTINADQAGDATYSAAPQVSRSFLVNAPVCASSYTQVGYVVTGCSGSNTPSGTVCTATCASGYAGSVAGVVTCTNNGTYAGSFTGCSLAPAVTFTAQPTLSSATESSITVSYTTSGTGDNVRVMAVSAGAAAPTAAAIIAGTGAVGTTPAKVATTGAAQTATITGLAAATSYDIYAALEVAGVVSTGLGVTTSASTCTIVGQTLVNGVCECPGGVPPATSTSCFVVGTKAKLAFQTQPGGARASTAFTQQPKVAIQDTNGSQTADTDAVKLAIKANTGAPGAVLTAIDTAAAAGLTTFTGVSIDRPGLGYVLTASSGTLTPAYSAAFAVCSANGQASGNICICNAGYTGSTCEVTPASLSGVNFTVSPATANSAAIMTVAFTQSSAMTTGSTISIGYTDFVVPPVMTITGSTGFSTGATFTATTSGGTVTITVTGTLAAGAPATLSFPVTNPAAKTVAKAGLTVRTSQVTTAVASASDIVITPNFCSPNPCQNGGICNPGPATYSCTCSAGYSGATCAIVQTPVTKIVFTAQPGGGAKDTPWSLQPVVTVQDLASNTVTSSSAQVTLSIRPAASATTSAAAKSIHAITKATICAVGEVLCGDGRTCAPWISACPTTPQCTLATRPFQCPDGSCAADFSRCPTTAACPATTILCPSTSACPGCCKPSASECAVPAAVLTCTANPLDATRGVASFAGCRVDQPGTYTLTATTPGSASATSSSFTIGCSPGEALVSGACVKCPPGKYSPAGATCIDAPAGYYVSISGAMAASMCPANSYSDRAGSVSCAACAAGYTSAPGSSFCIASVAKNLAFTTQPAGAVAGAAFTTQPAVTIQDANGNPVLNSINTVTLGIRQSQTTACNAPNVVCSAGTPSAGMCRSSQLACNESPLTCTANAVAAVAGVATFAGCRINQAGTGYVLTASATGLTAAESNSISVASTVGAATKLAFTTPPAGAVAGAAFTTQPVVTIQDANGNTVTGGSESILTVTLATKSGPGALTCTANAVAAVAGVATFTGCKVNAVGAHVLEATAGVLTAAVSSTLNVVGAPTLRFSTQPSAFAAAGKSLAVQPVVTFYKSDGTTVDTANTSTVTLALGGGDPTASLSGTTSVAAVAGVATFTGLSIDRVGSPYNLTATSTVSSPVTSTGITVQNSVTATKLVFSPITTPIESGSPSSFTVSAMDATGAVDPDRTGTVTITTADAARATALKGLLTASFVGGVASFPGVRLVGEGTYNLKATSDALTEASSAAIVVTRATTLAYLAFSSNPAFETTGVAFTTQPVVKAYAADGTVLTSYTGLVILRLRRATGATPSVLGGGSIAGSFTNGVATFSGLKVTGADTNLILAANASDGNAATSPVFDVYADATAAAMARSTEQAQSATFTIKFTHDSSVIKDDPANSLTADLCISLGLRVDSAACRRITIVTSFSSAGPGLGAASAQPAFAAVETCPSEVTGVGPVTVPPCMYSAPGTYRLVGMSPGFPTRTSNSFVVVDTLAGNLPGVPRNLRVVAGDGQLVASWDPPETSGAGNIIGYEVFGIQDGLPDVSLAKVQLTGKTLKLANGTEWRIGVKALNPLGGGEMARSALVRVGTAPAASKADAHGGAGNESPWGKVAAKLATGGCKVQRSELVAVPPDQGPGTGAVMLYGATGLELTDCPGGVANVTIGYPGVVQGMQVYLRFDGRWSELDPAQSALVVKGDTVSFGIADNGPWDADPQPGVISIVAGVGYIEAWLPERPSAPRNATAAAGLVSATVTWSAPAAGEAPVVRYTATATPGGATCTADAPATGCTVTGLASGTAYTFVVTAQNAAGATSSDPSAAVTPTGVIPRLVNLSTRGLVLNGDSVMIGGFVIGGTSPKRVLVTARGPSLAAQGVTGALANPTLKLFSGSAQIAANDDWGTELNATEIAATGLAPRNALESAVLLTLNPGAYTTVVSGSGGSSGIGIVEAYEVDRPDVPFANFSTRAPVFTGDNVMIAGFVVAGTAPKTFLITARGPSLAASGLPGLLADPALTLYSGMTPIAANDDWQTNANASAIAATGKAPTNPKESALLLTLQPGAYTAIVNGAGNTTGIGIVEVFAQ